MKKNSLFSYIAFGLLLTNLMLIGYIIFSKPKMPLGEGPKKIITERLKFDSKQMADYELLIKKHQADIRRQDSLIRLAKTELYTCISLNDTIRKDSALVKLGKLQIEVEEINYNHFLDIKKLCKKEQFPYFDELLKDLAQLFAKPTHPRPKH